MMPKNLHLRLMKQAKLKFHSTSSPKAKAYIYGTMNKIYLKHNTPKKLVLTGKPAYLNHMFLHLRKEHPSTKKRMYLLKGG